MVLSINEYKNFIKSSDILFIGGAPRSATSFCHSLFDGHPEILVFHPELLILRKWAFFIKEKPSEIDVLFKKETIGKDPKLRTLLDLNYRKYQEEKKFIETGIRQEIDVEPKSFIKWFYKFVNIFDKNIVGFLRSLAGAYWLSSATLRKSIKKPLLIVFKVPYYTELFAWAFPEELTDAYWIFTKREHKGRYLSAKMRRLYGKNSVPWINGDRFILGSAKVTYSSHWMISQLKTRKNVFIWEFEDINYNHHWLIQTFVKQLEIKWDPILTIPTYMAMPQPKNTAFKNSIGINRKDIINNAELKILDYFEELDKWYKKENDSIPKQPIYAWIKLHKYERMKDYIRAWKSWLFVVSPPIRKIKVLYQELPLKILSNNASVSGNT